MELRYVQNRLSLFTEFYTHHTRFLFAPNPNVVSYRPQISCRTSVVGRRFGPPKNFGAAPPMFGIDWLWLDFNSNTNRTKRINADDLYYIKFDT